MSRPNHLTLCLTFVMVSLSLGQENITCPRITWRDQLHMHGSLKNNYCSKHSKFGYIQRYKSLRTWNFSSHQILEQLPSDPVRDNFVREVPNSLFSYVNPTPFTTKILLAAYSKDVLNELLDMSAEIVNTSEFVEFVSGNIVFPGSRPKAHRYGGHQFGSWSGQLGDGRAHILGEYVNSKGDRWELQLKGSGLTPYSRHGDGRAVIRSSVREFLASEAMHYLGIPTSRAASLVVSNDEIIRDMFYNGNLRHERTAVVLRAAPSWLRMGSLEILAYQKELYLLKQTLDFTIQHHFPQIRNVKSPAERYVQFFSEVVRETAKMVVQWQSVGFVHGVCNTDNFSLLSITIDYGPFGFMDHYDPDTVPNTSDDEARYR